MSNVNWSIVGTVAVVLAIIAATTYLGAAGVVAGATVVQLFMTVLGALGVVGGVHVTTTAITRAGSASGTNNVPDSGTK